MNKKSYRPTIKAIENEDNIFIADEIIEPIISKPDKLYEVKVRHPSLRRRREPSTDSEILGLITDKGVYSIYVENQGWGQLEDGSWIMLEFTNKVK